MYGIWTNISANTAMFHLFTITYYPTEKVVTGWTAKKYLITSLPFLPESVSCCYLPSEHLNSVWKTQKSKVIRFLIFLLLTNHFRIVHHLKLELDTRTEFGGRTSPSDRQQLKKPVRYGGAKLLHYSWWLMVLIYHDKNIIHRGWDPLRCRNNHLREP